MAGNGATDTWVVGPVCKIAPPSIWGCNEVEGTTCELQSNEVVTARPLAPLAMRAVAIGLGDSRAGDCDCEAWALKTGCEPTRTSKLDS